MRRKVNGSDIASVVPSDLGAYIKNTNKDKYWIVGATNAVRQFAYVSTISEVQNGQFLNRAGQYLSGDLSTESERLLLGEGVSKIGRAHV